MHKTISEARHYYIMNSKQCQYQLSVIRHSVFWADEKAMRNKWKKFLSDSKVKDCFLMIDFICKPLLELFRILDLSICEMFEI